MAQGELLKIKRITELNSVYKKVNTLTVMIKEAEELRLKVSNLAEDIQEELKNLTPLIPKKQLERVQGLLGKAWMIFHA